MSGRLRVIWMFGVCASICSCASTHNLKDGSEGFWGGGYLVEPESEGTYKIIAKTNVAQWTNYGTARRMWKRRAQEACEGKPYVELEIREYTYERYPRNLWNRYVVTVKEGMAVCSQ